MGSRSGRTGLLGGTFDPIHEGHLDVADAARDALALDEVWLVPAPVDEYIRRHRLYPPSSAADLHEHE